MAAQAEGSWRLKPGSYLGEISALAFLPLPSSPFPLLLAGTGSHILSYDVSTGGCLGSFLAFRGVRVHGIALRPPAGGRSPVEIAVFGEKRLILVRVRVSSDLAVSMELACRLPGFNQWVLDALFIEEGRRLAVGLGDNSVAVWDVTRAGLVLRVRSIDRCLLYSMRLWGGNVESLLIASGTIYNEIVIYKLTARNTLTDEKDDTCKFSSCNSMQSHGQGYIMVPLHRLSGHEGSIFRMAWSSDGSTLISASDDRSARIWKISRQHQFLHEILEPQVSEAHLTLYGHDARIWDCYISDVIFITVGEDCTCRMWNTEGYQIMIIREHIGRGIWRCLYDPEASLLITAGFDSAIKVHLLPSSIGSSKSQNEVLGDLKDKEELFCFCAPKATESLSLLDSKSEYIRCLHFSQEDILYVGTNNGILYSVCLLSNNDAKWSQVAQTTEKSPIICLDLMTVSSSTDATCQEDMIAIGDGKGTAMVLRVTNLLSNTSLVVSISWEAERERQLLGIYWCKSLGCSHLFTADPRGTLKMWRVADSLHLTMNNNKAKADASLVAIFHSGFGNRIVCLDATSAQEITVLGCGDQRGNVSIFVLSNMLLSFHNNDAREISPVTQFKGAHGISSVATLSMATLNSNEVEICTTGGDGCICYFKFSCISNKLEFMGMKQVKGLNMVKSVIGASSSDRDLSCHKYAAGFTSADFIVWNMVDEMKIKQVSCGGWRRPYSYYFGDYPDIQNCFAFVKDHTIHVHRIWLSSSGKKRHSKIIHMQFHGREVHTLCFISFGFSKGLFPDNGLWLATGCEDGTVRLTRYAKTQKDAWSYSQLLGEHVGGSAVKSVCFISKIYTWSPIQSHEGNGIVKSHKSDEDQFLLISVGAKQVLTLWLLQYKPSSEREAEATMSDRIASTSPNNPCLSFQWLSTHIPPRISNAFLRKVEFAKYSQIRNISLERHSHLTTSCLGGELGGVVNFASACKSENDWRYMAVTSFYVKTTDSRLSVCFVVVAGSDGTVVMRAFLVLQRLWFDVASLVPNASPILTLKHVVFRPIEKSEDDSQIENVFIVIGGSTCGSISFWDVTDSVRRFLESLMAIPLENIAWQKRPRTGRGSQGGRRWKLSPCISGRKNNRGRKMDGSEEGDERKHAEASVEGRYMENFKLKDDRKGSIDVDNNALHVNEGGRKLSETGADEVHPSLVLESPHQSGVNCLHVSEMGKAVDSGPGLSYCLLSGGDDQSLHFMVFDLEPQATCLHSIQNNSDGIDFGEKVPKSRVHYRRKVRNLHSSKVISAHNSAVKGVWTDGMWAFSTGLDQRIRCWWIADYGELVEHGHLIISVPEPESLDAVASERNRYQIAVAGRGLQMAEFIADAEDG